jgi:hypothetical protein
MNSRLEREDNIAIIMMLPFCLWLNEKVVVVHLRTLMDDLEHRARHSITNDSIHGETCLGRHGTARNFVAKSRDFRID